MDQEKTERKHTLQYTETLVQTKKGKGILTYAEDFHVEMFARRRLEENLHHVHNAIMPS